MTRRRSWWGWGWEDEAVSPAQAHKLGAALSSRFGGADLAVHPPPLARATRPARAPRAPTTALGRDLFTDDRARPCRRTPTASRTATSCVASTATSRNRPTSSRSPATKPTSSRCSTGARARAWPRCPTAADRRSSAASRRGSSTTPTPAWSRSTSRRSTGCSRSTECHARHASKAARSGPALEDQLRPHGFTLRHFPQSFEFSTLGGWLATRSGGHYASVYTHIDDFVESMRVVTPGGVMRVTPAARARARGRRPTACALGQRRHARHHHRGVDAGAGPRRFKASAGVRFADYDGRCRGDARRRAVGLFPTNCRLLDATEATGRRPASTTAARCSCSGSSRPTIRSTRGSSARSSCAATTAARCPTAYASARPDDATPASRGRGRRLAQLVPARARTDATRSCRWRDRRDVRDRVHVGRSSPRCTPARSTRSSRRLRRRSAAAAGSRAGSRTCIPDGPAPYFTVHRARALGLGAVEVGGDQGRGVGGACSPTAARSRTTTPSAATTDRGTTANAPTLSRPRSSRPSARSTRPASSTPACSSTHECAARDASQYGARHDETTGHGRTCPRRASTPHDRVP